MLPKPPRRGSVASARRVHRCAGLGAQRGFRPRGGSGGAAKELWSVIVSGARGAAGADACAPALGAARADVFSERHQTVAADAAEINGRGALRAFHAAQEFLDDDVRGVQVVSLNQFGDVGV